MIVAYDLETCIMKKGFKRKQGLILEIGAYDIFLDRCFRCFVNPTQQALTKNNYIEILEANGARPYPTQTHAENIRYDPEKAISLPVALQQFITFIKGADVICAHNGKSFDDQIVQGSLERCGLQWPKELGFLDTYHDVSKKIWPKRRSYKLQVLHRTFCTNSNLKWHTALDDSIGLSDLLSAAARHTVSNNVEIAGKFIENDYGIARINRQFGVQFPQNLSQTIGNKTKNAVRKMLISKKTNKQISHLCLKICLKKNLWKIRH